MGMFYHFYKPKQSESETSFFKFQFVFWPSIPLKTGSTLKGKKLLLEKQILFFKS